MWPRGFQQHKVAMTICRVGLLKILIIHCIVSNSQFACLILLSASYQHWNIFGKTFLRFFSAKFTNRSSNPNGRKYVAQRKGERKISWHFSPQPRLRAAHAHRLDQSCIYCRKLQGKITLGTIRAAKTLGFFSIVPWKEVDLKIWIALWLEYVD